MDTQALLDTQLLRAEEVARILNIGRSTVYLLCRQGKLPYVLIGSAIRIPAPELSAWLKQRTNLPEDIA